MVAGTLLYSQSSDFDDIFILNLPPSDILGQHLVALLNSDKPGRVFIGVRDNAIVKGVTMTRKQKDSVRQGNSATVRSRLSGNGASIES